MVAAPDRAHAVAAAERFRALRASRRWSVEQLTLSTVEFAIEVATRPDQLLALADTLEQLAHENALCHFPSLTADCQCLAGQLRDEVRLWPR